MSEEMKAEKPKKHSSKKVSAEAAKQGTLLERRAKRQAEKKPEDRESPFASVEQ